MSLSDSSVNRWLERLKGGDNLAAERFWNSYFERLVYLAHGRLQSRLRKVIDAEDVALSAFHSFCRGVKQNRYPALCDQDGLWKLLVSITIHKILHVNRDQNRLKRGGGFVELEGFDSSSDSFAVINQVVSREPSPEFAAEVAEQFEKLMHALGDEELVRFATWKLEGYSNDEIATKVNRSTRTIERKLNLIRKIWIRREIEQNESES